MPYVKPEEVVSPKANWTLVDVVLDRGEGECAYAIGLWDRKRRIGFRWNGEADRPLGNPQTRGIPTWTILDPKLYRSVERLVELENHEKLPIMRAFFGRRVEDG